MGRSLDVQHLVGARETAQRLGLVRVQSLHYFRGADANFPAAVYWTAIGRGGTGVWYWPDIWRWARRSGRPEFVEVGPMRCPGAPTHTRRVDVGDLVDTKRIAASLGLARIQAVHGLWRGDPTFPEPVFISTGGR